MSRRPFVRPAEPATWYLRQHRYHIYMLREACCILVAVYSVLMLSALAALSSAHDYAWTDFLTGQQRLAWVIFHAFALVYFIAYQTMPWFKLAPKAMPLQMGGTPVPAGAIVAGHYLAWMVVTAAVFWLTGVF